MNEKGYKKCQTCGAAVPIFMATKKRPRYSENDDHSQTQGGSVLSKLARKLFKYHSFISDNQRARSYDHVSTDKTYYLAERTNHTDIEHLRMAGDTGNPSRTQAQNYF